MLRSFPASERKTSMSSRCVVRAFFARPIPQYPNEETSLKSLLLLPLLLLKGSCLLLGAAPLPVFVVDFCDEKGCVSVVSLSEREREREKKRRARIELCLSLDVLSKESQNHMFRVYKFRVLNEK